MIGDKKERMFVLMVNGILTSIPESKLTMEQHSEIYRKLVEQVNAASDVARGWLGQEILKQNGVDVYPPGTPLPKFTKKQKKGMKQIIIKTETDEKKKTEKNKGNVL